MSQAPTTELTETSESKEELDPELLGLPDPPKRDRTIVVGLLLFTAVASLAMVVALRRDAAYAFSSPRARDLGDLNTASPESFAENQYVEGRVMLGAARAIRYERPLVSDSFRLMPLAGRETVWAEVHVPPREENVRWVPPSRVSGRLVRFDAAGPRHRGLADAVRDATGQDVPKDAWLLVEGATPSDARWAVILVGLFACFAAWNAFATAKLLRKVNG
ncbi:MAG TPA: hypothetical protein VM925_20410 [Labilithrix sp.]|jgi:hypothetical protein|nr:hypothetical protein [Labilithrix sp.]